MKTRLAALAVLLMAGAAPAAFAQDQGDHHDRSDQRGGERPAMAPGQRAPEARAWHGPAFTPRTPPAPPQARQAPAAPTAPAPGGQAPGGHWGGGPGSEPGYRHWGGTPPSGAPGGRWTPPTGARPDGFRDRGGPPAERANPQSQGRDWSRFHGGSDGRPQVDSWGRDHGGDHGGDRGGDRGRDRGGDRGDHGNWRAGDHGDHGSPGDHRDWRGDGDHRGAGGDHSRWRPGAYPHSYESHHRFHWRPYRYPSGFYAQTWAFGEFLPQALFAPDYTIEDWWDFDLPQPPYGYDWVRVGDDALLVSEYDGQIVQVVRDLFW